MPEAINLTVPDLRRVHPLWLSRLDKWREIEDVRNCCPNKKRYVHKGTQEFAEDYELRVKMTRWVPEAPSARDRLLGGVFAALPDLTGLPDEIQKWAAKVDRRRRSFLDWLEVKLGPLLADFGSAPVLLERPPAPEGAKIETRQEQVELGLLEPMVRAYSPLHVRNWETTSTGELEWVLTVEDSTLPPATPAGPRTPSKVYRLWTKTSWHEWVTVPENLDLGFRDTGWKASGEANEPQPGQGERIHDSRAGDHGLTVVPWVVFILDEESDFLGRSLVANSVELDLKRLLLDSDQTWDLWNHAHPLLKVKTKSQLSQIGLGTGAAIKLSPDKEEPEDAEYLTLPTESFQARQVEIEQVVRDIYRHVGVDPLGVLTGNAKSAEASGVARAWSFETSEGRHVSRFRKRLQEGVNGLLRLAAAYLGSELKDENPVRFPERPIDEPPADTLEIAQGARTVIRSPTARKLLEKRTTFAVLPDLTDDERRTIEKEIESAPDEDPLATFDFGGAVNGSGIPDPNAPPPPGSQNNGRTPARVQT